MLAPALPRVVQHIQGRAIGPLDVIDEKHDRSPFAERLSQAGHGFKQANACRRFISYDRWQ